MYKDDKVNFKKNILINLETYVIRQDEEMHTKRCNNIQLKWNAHLQSDFHFFEANLFPIMTVSFS